jgi:hypothetical protein
VLTAVAVDVGYAKARLWGTPEGLYEHILTAPNQQQAVRKILDLTGVTHVLVMDFDERLMIVLVAGRFSRLIYIYIYKRLACADQTAYLAPFPSADSMLEVTRLKRIGTNITHIAAGVLVSQPPPPPPAGSSPPSAFVDPSKHAASTSKPDNNTLSLW